MSFNYRVYEFSTGIIEEYQDGIWVSGGFTGRFAKANYPVPDEISQAVSRGDFIVDYSVLGMGVNLVVIPGKIDNYYVLAVATQMSDLCRRSFIIYRYFWLEIHNDTNTDGFATLLLWWFEAGQPRFEFSYTPSLPQFAQPCTSVNFDGYILPTKHYSQIRVRSISSIRFLLDEDIKKLELIFTCFDRLSKLESENAIINRLIANKIYLLINPIYENKNLKRFIILCSNDSELIYVKPILNSLRRLLSDSDEEINWVPQASRPPVAAPVPTILSSKFLATLIITGLLAGFVYGFVTVILMNFSNKNMEDKKSPKIEKLVSPPILLNW